MKTILSAVFFTILLQFSSQAFSQNVYFSESTYPSGYKPASVSSEFSCYDTYKCYVYCHAWSYSEFNVEVVAFDIYKYDYNSSEYYFLRTQYRYSHKNSFDYSLVAAIDFYTSGDYLVKVFDGEGKYIGAGQVRMNLY